MRIKLVILVTVLLVYSCSTTEKTEQISIKQKPIEKEDNSYKKYLQHLADTKVIVPEKISNRIRLYGQILCPGIPRKSCGFDRPFDIKDIYSDYIHQPQICGKFSYTILRITEKDTLAFHTLNTDKNGRFDVALPYGKYEVTPNIDSIIVQEFEKSIVRKIYKTRFHEVITRKSYFEIQKDSVLEWYLQPIREDLFPQILKGIASINAPAPTPMRKSG